MEALLGSPQHGAVCSEPLNSSCWRKRLTSKHRTGPSRGVQEGSESRGTVCPHSAATQVGTSTRTATCWTGGVTSRPSTSENSHSA